MNDKKKLNRIKKKSQLFQTRRKKPKQNMKYLLFFFFLMSNFQITYESSLSMLLVLHRFRFFSSVLDLSSDAGEVFF